MKQNIDLKSGITLGDADATCACGGHGAGHAHGDAAQGAAGGCACGGAGHGAGHSHEHGHSHDHHDGHEASASVATTVGVTGMTCEHCVASVTEEISAYAGVTNVAVALEPGGVSQVTVTSLEPIDPANLDAAIRDAGYQLA